MITFLKGMLIGFGKIIPGVSGSVLAISLGVYEKCIDIISNLFYEIRYQIKFLTLLCLGILTSILIGSRLIYFLLEQNYFLTLCLFIGLIAGTIPSVFKATEYASKKDMILVLLPIIFIYLISLFQNGEMIISNNFSGYLMSFFLGFIDALTMIIPGVSGTAIFMMMGSYSFILSLFSNLTFPFIIFFGLGVILGVIIVSKFMNYFFKNHRHQIYLVILGLSISSLCYLIIDTFIRDYTVLQFVLGLIFIGFGYFVSNLLDSK